VRLGLPPLKVFAYILILFLLLLGVEGVLWRLSHQESFSWRDVVFWAVLAFLGTRTRVELPFNASMSHLFVVALAIAAALPAWLAPLIVFFAYVDRKLGRPDYPWYKELFNKTQHGLATGLAGLVWYEVMKHGKFLSGDLGIYLSQALGIFLASTTYLLVNITAVTYVIHLASGAPLRKIWFENYGWLWKSCLILSPVGLLLAKSYTTPLVFGWGGFTVMFLMVLLYFSRYYWDEKVKLEEAFDNTIEVLVQALDAKDPFTRLHSERVAAITADMAKRMGFDDPDLKRITYAARIHDIGKVAIPDSVLLKPSKLSAEEFALIKSHPNRGIEVLRPMLPFLAKGVKQVILHHHERWDGRGYPEGQQGEQIHPWARMVSLADAYEAMTAGRSYVAAKSPEVAFNEIMGLAGRQFDPEAAKVFEQAWLEDPSWKDREVFLRAYSSPLPSLEWPLPSSPEPVPATSPTSS
jgi:HD-GYP domain-containing protein (c-di-GMP phosphodiesterase class II)